MAQTPHEYTTFFLLRVVTLLAVPATLWVSHRKLRLLHLCTHNVRHSAGTVLELVKQKGILYRVRETASDQCSCRMKERAKGCKKGAPTAPADTDHKINSMPCEADCNNLCSLCSLDLSGQLEHARKLSGCIRSDWSAWGVQKGQQHSPRSSRGEACS